MKRTKPPVVREALLQYLRDAGGVPRTMSEIVEHLYGAREDGGPLHANGVVWLTVKDLRRDGVKVLSKRGRGMSGYWLAPS